MLEQLGDMCELKGEDAAVREMRKVVGWYIKGMPGSAAVRGTVNQLTSRAEMEELIQTCFVSDGKGIIEKEKSI